MYPSFFLGTAGRAGRKKKAGERAAKMSVAGKERSHDHSSFLVALGLMKDFIIGRLYEY